MYDVSVFTHNENGCVSSSSIANMITVFDVPEAKFIADKLVVESLKSEINFTNLSIGANYYYWSFGDGDTSNIKNPTHNYLNNNFEGYKALLIVENVYGCKDTASQLIEIKDFVTFWAPTSFTPDGDYINDEFFCKGVGIDNNTFILKIYNRWGEPVFITNDINKGWDGRVKGKTEISEIGSYSWIVNFKDNTGLKHSRTGTIMLIK